MMLPAWDGASPTFLGLRPWEEHGELRNHDNPPGVKDPVAHAEGADNAEPDLSRLLLEVEQRLSELGVETEPAMHFFHGRHKRLAVAALPSNVCQGEQPLPHAFRVHHPIWHWFG